MSISVTVVSQEVREESNEELLGLVEKHADHTLHRNHYLLIGIKEQQPESPRKLMK